FSSRRRHTSFSRDWTSDVCSSDLQIDYSVLEKLDKAGFKDSYRLLNDTFASSVPTFKSGEGKIKSSNAGIGKRIDFLWANPVAAKMVTKSTIIKNDQTHVISDHYPVYVELTLPENR